MFKPSCSGSVMYFVPLRQIKSLSFPMCKMEFKNKKMISKKISKHKGKKNF